MTIRESGSLNSVSYVISGKTPFVVSTEKGILSNASKLRAEGISMTTMTGDTHVGARYCQYTVPNTAATTHLTVYSTSAALGNATCADLESRGLF